MSTSKFEDHLWRELVREHGDDLSRLNRPAGGHALLRPRLVAGTMAVAAAVIIVAATTLVTLHSPSAKPAQTTTTNAPNRTTAPQWELVGNVSPSWHVVGSLSSNPGLSLTCPSAETCFAADSPSSGGVRLSAVEVTNDGGRTWTPSKLPVSLLGLAVPWFGQTRIACANARTCAILGVAGSVRCSDSSSCTVGNASATFEETTDGGKSWTVHGGPSGLSLVGVSAMTCPSASTCLAVAEGYSAAATYATTDGGRTWTTEQMPTDFVPHDLQCSSTANCVVSGFYQPDGGSQTTPKGTVLYTRDGGTTWRTALLASGLGSVGTVSCATANDCLATFSAIDGQGSEVLASTDGGEIWTSVPASGLPEGVVLSTACQAAAQCWVAGATHAQISADGLATLAGSAAFLASTTDGGRTWHSTSAPDRVSLVESLSCPSTAKCYALAFAKPAGTAFISVVLLSYGD